MPVDYLKRILTAKVYDVAIESPLDFAPTLSARVGNRVLLKREDQQPVFSFKLRGAYNKMAHLPPGERSRGVVAASAGNHAQGVALAAQRLECEATIVMPVTTPSIKIHAVQARAASGADHHFAAHAHADPGSLRVIVTDCHALVPPTAFLNRPAENGGARFQTCPPTGHHSSKSRKLSKAWRISASFAVTML